MSWLPGYSYRRQFTVYGTAAGAQTNYQKRLRINETDIRDNNNITVNGSFESGTPPSNWTAGGTTISRSTDHVHDGTYSLKVVNTGGSNSTVYQVISSDYAGRYITVGCWVWCDTANNARITTWGGTYSSYHPGDSQWHWLQISNVISATSQVIYCITDVSSATSYFDNYYAIVDCESCIELNTHCRTDLGDIRFTTSDGVTLVDYWIESVSGSTPHQIVDVWVEFSYVPASPSSATFYVYYGKSSDTTVSNVDNTWLKADDFESYADSGNPTKWTNSTDTFTADTAQEYQGSKSGKVVVGGSAGSRSLSLAVATATPRVIATLRPQATNKDIRTIIGDGSYWGPHVIFEVDGYLKYYDGSMHTIQAYSANTWYRLEYNNFNFTTHKFDLWVNGIKKVSAGGYWNSSTTGCLLFYVYEGATTQTHHMDMVLIGKYCSPEPVCSGMGTEELNTGWSHYIYGTLPVEVFGRSVSNISQINDLS